MERSATPSPTIESTTATANSAVGSGRDRPRDCARAEAHTVSRTPEATSTNQAMTTPLPCPPSSCVGYGARSRPSHRVSLPAPEAYPAADPVDPSTDADGAGCDAPGPVVSA